MEDDKFQHLLDAIDASKKDLETEFSTKITKLQQEVTAGQESSSKEVVQKIQKRAYQFRRKGNEEQFKFNSAVEEHFDAVKELGKLEPHGEAENKIVKHMKAHLDEGTKTIAVRQKHIKIADRFDLGWAVIEAYMDDELASDSDDKRRMYKANREAQQSMKRKRSESAAAAAKRRATANPEPPPPAQGKVSQGTRPPVSRPWMIGPCYRCGEMGHLVANCPKSKQQYPFEHSLVKGVDLGMSFVSRECVDVIKKVDIEKGEWAALSPEGVDNVIAIEQDKRE